MVVTMVMLGELSAGIYLPVKTPTLESEVGAKTKTRF